ncbi:hypothetical protein KKH23_08140, partial [Patescibacteria group bacterium]|nr:hypothetical protein [Patescibacteria group bacterium]
MSFIKYYMVSPPIPDDIPAPDQATVDIRGALAIMGDPVCGWLRVPLFVVIFAEPTNTALPLYVPVSGAVVEGRVNLISTKTGYTNANGIGYACLSSVGTFWVDFRVRKNDVDFGEGKGVWSDWKGYSVPIALQPKIITFSGKIDIPCPIMRNISITAVSGFDDLISKPHIVATLYPPSFPGYGSISTAGSPFEIYLNDTKLGSGTISSAGDIDFTAPSELQDISGITQWGQSVTLKIIANIAGCEFQGTRTITLPTIPEIPDICTAWETAASISLPGQLNALSVPVNISNAKWNCPSLSTSEPINGIGRLKIGTFLVNFNINNGLAGFDLKDKLSLSALLSSLASLSNINVEIMIPDKDSGYTTFTELISIPSVEPVVCVTWNTVASPSVPATLRTPFPISVSGAKWVCEETGEGVPIT